MNVAVKAKLNLKQLDQQCKAELKPDQIAAYDHVVNWYYNVCVAGKNEMLIEGAPGTGKTFVSARILRRIGTEHLAKRDRKLRVCLCSPTSTAVDVLSEMAYDSGPGLLDVVDFTCQTAHQLLRLKPSQPDGDNKTKIVHNPNAQTPMPPEFDLVVLDECSMLDNALDEALSNYGWVPILYLGDRDQIPPVAHADAEFAGVFSLEDEFIVTLKSNKRFGGNLLAYVTAMKDSDELRIISPVPFANGKELITVRDRNLLLDTALQAFDRGLDARVLCFTNRNVAQYNNAIRRQFHGDALHYQIGELMATVEDLYKPDPCDDDPYRMSRNVRKNKAVTVLDAHEEMLWVNCDIRVPVLRLTIKFKHRVNGVITDMIETTTVLHPQPEKRLEAMTYLAGLRSTAEALSASGEKREAADMWDEIASACRQLGLFQRSNQFLNSIQPRYASTVDKAQGSSIDLVLIHDDVYNAPIMGKTQAERNGSQIRNVARWYTAVSRARKRVIALL